MEGVDDVDGGGEEDAVALEAGGMTESGGEVCFAQTDQTEEDDVAVVAHEVEVEEVLDFETVNFLRPVPAEGIEGFDDGKAGGFDASGDGAIGTSGGFALDELGEVLQMGEGVLGGLGGGGMAVLLAKG